MQLMLKFFLLGIIGAAGALFLEIILSLAFPIETVGISYFQKFTWLLFGVVLIEEIFKVSLVAKSLKFAQKNNFILGSLILGFGFGITELALKRAYDNNQLWGGELSALLIHILTCILAGFLLSRQNSSRKNFFLALLINFSIHLAYNISVISLF